MLARYLRFMLVLELAAYALTAEWLHFLFAWGYAPLALLAIAAALAGRFAMVCVAGTGEARVTVIAHSMGGLGARAYLRTHGAGRVRKLITIATPHHGTVHARFGAGDNARQMSRGSRFLEELREQEGLRGPD